MYKMVAIDLDDTLLNDEFEISEKNKQAVQKAIEKGVVVCIISGRSFSSVKNYLSDLKISYLCGSINGAMITDPASGKNVFVQTVDDKVTGEILKEIELLGMHVNYYHDHKVVCSEKNDIAEDYIKLTGVEIEFVGSLQKYHEGASAGKLLLIDHRDTLESLRKKFQKTYGEQINITFSKPTFLEIYSKKVSKGEAVKTIAQYYGFEQGEIIAIGDGENDMFMIEYAGLGVAMGNSNETVQSRADFVTLTNNEGGVAHVLEKFIL